MCGIVGYIGNREVVPILIDGLKKLEYRGYDSAGIAVLCNNKINVIKCKGRLKNLEDKINCYMAEHCGNEGNGNNNPLNGKIGIGHTRWATHGEPNDINSHPHTSTSGKIAVVHNGIIENYMKLKESLIQKGFVFSSETDTEVIAQLIEYYYKGDLLEAVLDALKQLEGSYAMAVISREWPDRFIVARKGSPLIIGLGEGENFIASDIPAILSHTRNAYLLEDDEVAVIKKDSVTVCDYLGNMINKEIFRIEWDVSSAEKSGYEHFMIKEICEEPDALKNTINPRLRNGSIMAEADNFHISKEELENIGKIYIVACGTAYHAGVVGKYIIEKLTRIPVEVDIASEFRYRDPIIKPGDIAIIISQSGETIDTLYALREAKKRGAKVISIVNVVGSTIARESDEVLYTWAGPEIAVASTKAYNTQLALLYLIALDLALKKGTIDHKTAEEIISELKRVPDYLTYVISNRGELQKFAAGHYNAKSVFFIGRGLDYAVAMEASLKLKEISYIHSEAYAGGELKHGTIALIEEGTLVVAIAIQDALKEKIISNIKEVKARGAVVLAITRECEAEEVAKVADVVISIPDIQPMLAPLVAITPLQLLAYYMAVQKGCDVDKPRNLAKSVTVE